VFLFEFQICLLIQTRFNVQFTSHFCLTRTASKTETAPIPDNVHQLPAWRIREGFSEDSLPRCIPARRNGTDNRSDRSKGTSMVSEQTSKMAKTSETNGQEHVYIYAARLVWICLYMTPDYLCCICVQQVGINTLQHYSFHGRSNVYIMCTQSC